MSLWPPFGSGLLRLPSSAQAESERYFPRRGWGTHGPAAGAGAGATHSSEEVARRESGVYEKPRGCCPFPKVTPTFFLSCRHYPKQSFTMVADTPENLRLKQQSELQSQVRGRGPVLGPGGEGALL